MLNFSSVWKLIWKQYLPEGLIHRLNVNASVFLIGCSSADPSIIGEFEPYRKLLDYMMAGCPCVVGNL
jgi:separase